RKPPILEPPSLQACLGMVLVALLTQRQGSIPWESDCAVPDALRAAHEGGRQAGQCPHHLLGRWLARCSNFAHHEWPRWLPSFERASAKCRHAIRSFPGDTPVV